MKTDHAVLSLTLLSASFAFTHQTPPPDGLVSPEVHSDRTVTFRVRAPKAGEVTLSGDRIAVGKTQTEPLEANGHLYRLNLDGVAIAGPINPVIKMRQRTSARLVEVPAAAPSPWDVRDVPHGTVLTEWQKSAVLGRTGKATPMIVVMPVGHAVPVAAVRRTTTSFSGSTSGSTL